MHIQLASLTALRDSDAVAPRTKSTCSRRCFRRRPTTTTEHVQRCIYYSVSQKIPPRFSDIFSQTVGNLVKISLAYYTFQSTLNCYFSFNYLQLWWSYAILSATAIICSKCPPSAETLAGWSHLIWYNFVTIGDKQIKICTLTQIEPRNRHVKFGAKILSCLVKIAENASMRFGQWWTFCAYDVNWVVWSRLTWHNFVKVVANWIKICVVA